MKKIEEILGLVEDAPIEKNSNEIKRESVMAKIKKLVAKSTAGKAAVAKKPPVKPQKSLKTTVKTNVKITKK